MVYFRVSTSEQGVEMQFEKRTVQTPAQLEQECERLTTEDLTLFSVDGAEGEWVILANEGGTRQVTVEVAA